MTAKIVTSVLITIFNLTVGVILIFFLMLGLNGFSERDADYAFLTFIIGSVCATIFDIIAGIFLFNFLIRKDFGSVSASTISIVTFSIVGILLEIVLCFGGILIADLVRTSI